MNQPISITLVDGNVIAMSTTMHKEFNKESLDWAIQQTLNAGKEISKSVGENWFPCGFVNLHTDGRSELVKFIKKHGEHDSFYLRYKNIDISKDDFRGGYSIYFSYPATNATEQQSLNFKDPLYQVFQKYLALLNINTSKESRMD